MSHLYHISFLLHFQEGDHAKDDDDGDEVNDPELQVKGKGISPLKQVS